MTTDELESVVTRMQQGDRAAYGELLDRFQPSVFRMAHRVTGNREDAWDVVQEVFLAVLRRRAELRDPARFRSWLYRLAHGTAVDRVRARHGATFEVLEDAPTPVETAPERRAESGALADELGRAMAALPSKFREPLLLATHGELSYEQIAGELECPVGTIRSRIATARQLLRTRLAAWLAQG
ncbi:MAG: sigma-70 family RNA polymerase sigma factor [Candidatus Riflebacteria bacterium]|nr:sigma-70 family RNA polymerase sigma factor [Candidatus Riflebacteria bacterium]